MSKKLTFLVCSLAALLFVGVAVAPVTADVPAGGFDAGVSASQISVPHLQISTHKSPTIEHKDPTEVDQADAGFLEGADGPYGGCYDTVTGQLVGTVPSPDNQHYSTAERYCRLMFP